MNYITINEKLRIQSCSIEDLLQDDKNKFAEPLDNPETITMIYDPENDTVILNSVNEDYEFYKLLADAYLTVDKNTRFKIKQQVKEITQNSFDDTFKLLNTIVKQREHRKVEELKRILGKQYSDPYFNNLDIIEALSRKNEHKEDCFRFYDIFMYGYIQGIRAERTRMKKAAL